MSLFGQSLREHEEASRAAAARHHDPASTVGGMSHGEIRVLTALIQHPAGLTNDQISVFVALRQSTRRRYLQFLKQRAFVKQKVDQPGIFFATDAGRAAIPDLEPLPTGAELRDYWLRELPDGERRVLAALIDVYPGRLGIEELGERVNLRQSTRRRYLQFLAARRLVERQGNTVAACATLFDTYASEAHA